MRLWMKVEERFGRVCMKTGEGLDDEVENWYPSRSQMVLMSRCLPRYWFAQIPRVVTLPMNGNCFAPMMKVVDVVLYHAVIQDKNWAMAITCGQV